MDSFYDQTIPVLTRVTRTAEHILKKAEEYSKSTGTPIEELLTASLAPDMYSFSKQVGVVVLFARRAVHGLVGTELVPTELAEWSLEESRSVIADVLKLLADIKPEDVNGKELDTLTFAVGPAKSTQNIKDCTYLEQYRSPFL
ncbi:hypothetical protein F4811DRAFT_543893 [Daldinia bambusicola]|nr:hypothetical protein F4811DRAFT_543893 [Daldinia bambusicola]